MKKIVLILILIVSFSTLFARETNKKGFFGVKAGLAVSSIDGSWAVMNNSHLGAAAGFFYEHMVGRNWSLSADLLYSGQGVRQKFGDYQDIQRVDLHYINLPIMANFYLFKGFAVKIGIQPGIMLAGYDVSYDYEIDKRKARKLSGLNTFDLSIPMGISYDIKRFRIEARYNWGLTNLYEDSIVEVGHDSDMEFKVKSWNSVLAITVGYKF